MSDPTLPIRSDTNPDAAATGSYLDISGKWKRTVANFKANYNLLAQDGANIARLDPVVQANYQKTMASMSSVNKFIGSIDGAVADAEAWATGAWDKIKGWYGSASGYISNLLGYEQAQMEQVNLGDLGIVWLIPVAVIASGVAYVAGKALEAYQVHNQLAAMTGYVAKGYTPAQAAAAVKASQPGGIFEGASALVKNLMIAGVVLGGGFLVWKFFLKGKK
jgi:hypothetical protein